MTRGACPECGRWLQTNKRGEIARRHRLATFSVYPDGSFGHTMLWQALWCAGGKAIHVESTEQREEANRKAVAESEAAF